jgi:dethiobiotin synthetase
MAKRIFVTATNTDIGKTYTTQLLLKEYASKGLKVGVIKLIETGVIDSNAPDGKLLLSLVQELNPMFEDITLDDIVPLQYELPAAPYIASQATPLDFDKLTAAIEKLETLCDVLIMEGAGGLFVPIDDNFMMIDLILYFGASALLVTHCSLGCINDTLLSLQALKNRNIPSIVAFNCRENREEFAKLSEPYFLNNGYEVLKVDSDIDTICDVLYNL